MMVLIFSIFEFSVAMATMKVSKFLLATSVSFMVQRYACQLLLGACQLTFCMYTFTFCELESSLRWSIRSGMWEASKRDCEGKQCCCCPHFQRPSSGRENPPPKKGRMPSRTPEGEKAQHKKRGEEGHPSPPTHNFVMHSSPHLPNKAATICLWTAYQFAQTLHYICLTWMREEV